MNHNFDCPVLKRVSYNLTCGYGDINNERLAITGVDY
jgi:hypothetical protein